MYLQCILTANIIIMARFFLYVGGKLIMSDLFRIPLIVLGLGSAISVAIGLLMYAMITVAKKLSKNNNI